MNQADCETSWSLSFLDRTTLKPFCQIPLFNAQGALRDSGVSSAEIRFDLENCGSCACSIRDRGHWAYLRNHDDDTASIQGPVTRVSYDLEESDTSTPSVSVSITDPMTEYLEQVLFNATSTVMNPLEAARFLLAEANVTTPLKVEAYPMDGFLPLEIIRFQRVSEWWDTLALTAMDWHVEKDTLYLGDRERTPLVVSPDSWQDRGVSLTFGDPRANLIIFKGRDDLVSIWPNETYQPVGFYPRIPGIFEDTNVTSQVVADQIAERLWNARNQNDPKVAGINSFNLPWSDTKPGRRVRMTSQICAGSDRIEQTARIQQVQFTIADNVEVDRTVLLGSVRDLKTAA